MRGIVPLQVHVQIQIQIQVQLQLFFYVLIPIPINFILIWGEDACHIFVQVHKEGEGYQFVDLHVTVTLQQSQNESNRTLSELNWQEENDSLLQYLSRFTLHAAVGRIKLSSNNPLKNMNVILKLTIFPFIGTSPMIMNFVFVKLNR